MTETETDQDKNLLVHKVALDPNNAQETFFRRCAEVSRDTYNWALGEWDRLYKAGEKPSAYELQKRFTAVKKLGNVGDAHLSEVPQCLTEDAIGQVGEAYKRYFKGQNRRPTRKKHQCARDSFLAARCRPNWQPPVSGHYIKLPRVGWIKMHHELRFTGRIKRVTVSRKANRWYAAVLFETPESLPIASAAAGRGAVGVDLGVRKLAVAYDGFNYRVFEGSKALESNLKLLRRAQKDVSRKVKGSANRARCVERVAKIHDRVANIRKDALHNLTTQLVRDYSTIVVEDLNVKGMLKGKGARGISDSSFGEFRRQLEYKATTAGVDVVIADRWYPSSKTCSECGTRNPDIGSKETFTCVGCGTRHDRDYNAAKNLASYAGAASVSACGETKRWPASSGDGGTGLDEAGTGLGCEQRPSAGEKVSPESEDFATESRL